MLKPIFESINVETLDTKEINGNTFFLAKNAPNITKARHEHGFCYYTFLISGNATELIEGGKKLVYKPYEVHFQPANQVHTTEIGSEGSLAIAIAPDKEILDHMRRSGVDISSPWTLSDRKISELAVQIEDAMRNSSDPTTQLSELFEKLIDLSMDYVRGAFGHVQPWLIRAKEFVQAHPNKALTLQEIADEVGIHPVHLAQEFKKHFGATVGEYVRVLRMEQARHLLVTSNYSIAEISNKLGFYDHAHFVKVFKTKCGQTPSAYRREFGKPKLLSRRLRMEAMGNS
jgi:AraC family transcriptional regulator